jgi:hypothetical protein
MKNIINLSIVALILSLFSIQTAWAASTAEVVAAAVQKSTEAEKAEIEKAHKEFQTTGGKIVVGRDGSVRVYPNGPTVGQRVVLVAAEVKNNVVWATTTAVNGAKAADGSIVGTVTYPVVALGKWMSSEPDNTELTKEDVAAFTGKPVESLTPKAE